MNHDVTLKLREDKLRLWYLVDTFLVLQVKNLRTVIMQELESALAQQAPPPPQEDPSLYELPPLVIDGIPTPVEKMTQAQLRAFIPLMLKYSTGELR